MPDLLEEGLLLFNSHKYFEAHEVWEDLWRSVENPGYKTCCQGLIQAAVALHHLSRGNSTGARSQLQKSIRNLEAAGTKPPNLDIPGLIGQLAAVLRDLPEAAPPGLAIARLK